MPTDRTIDRALLERMIRTIDEEWRLRTGTLADSGHMAVYHLDVETSAGDRHLVLKATPDGDDYGIRLEARLLALLESETGLPVPEVLGAVDDHGALPTPFFVMTELPGRSIPRKQLGDLSPDTVAAIARQAGRYAAELHDLDVVDAFGYLDVEIDHQLRGNRPTTSPDAITVSDPEPDWPTCLREWTDQVLPGLADTRFADLTEEIEPVLQAGIDSLDAPYRPALCHADYSIENLLVGETGDVAGMADWAFTLAAPPAYDLLQLEWSLSGGHWRFVPGVPDHRPVVREAMLDGYHSRGSTRVVDRYHTDRDAYELHTAVHAMMDFDDWFELKGGTDEQVRGAAVGLEDRVAALVETT